MLEEAKQKQSQIKYHRRHPVLMISQNPLHTNQPPTSQNDNLKNRKKKKYIHNFQATSASSTLNCQKNIITINNRNIKSIF
jgi:hypothetical protein